ncbi:12347_t:CDS:2 [Funneliformis geosporum]|uniref:7653_t:CDS:1 n=1 Tax=Funneliformis geosporum TaxID=1117311 RepID=A0A9W4WPA0_9GLOM|nr:12347_t:CDS:2 [Funneliformis geosporum]CAI2176816.1 7653_t:CDS:2 [Funneliformis geosporum]
MVGCSLYNEGNVETDIVPQFNFIIGIVIAVSTSFVQSLGLTIQRKSHVLNENVHPKELRRSACKRPLWHLGFDTYIISNIIGSVFSIGYLPIVILAPLGAVTLVFNALFAKLLLGDVFTKQTIIGTFFILIGAVMIALFGVVNEPNHSLEDLIELYKRPAFIVYFSIIELMIMIFLVTNKFGEYALDQMIRNERDLTLGWSVKNFQKVLGISYGCVGGMISGQSLLFAKSGIELLLLSIFNCDNQFNRPFSWFIVIALIVTSLLQLYYLNKGLRLCDTVILVPLSFCTYNVSTIFNGLVYYNQWNRLHWWQIFLVIVGIIILICGVLVLSWRRSTAPEEELLDDSMLLGRDLEGLTELYEGEEFNIYAENMDMNNSESYHNYYSLGENSSTSGMLTFEQSDEENDDADEKSSLLGKR